MREQDGYLSSFSPHLVFSTNKGSLATGCRICNICRKFMHEVNFDYTHISFKIL